MKRLGIGFMYGLGVLWVIPFVWVVWTSFRPEKLVTTEGFQWGFTFANYVDAWNGAPFMQYYWNTIWIVVGVLAAQLVTTTLAAYAFARLNFWAKDLIFLLFLLQLMIPADILIFPNYNTMRGLSLLETKWAIILPYFTSALGIFLMRQAFKTVSEELEEAARLDGCNLLQIIWYVFVPLARPTYVAFGLVSVSHHWNNFLWPLIVTNSDENRPITVGLARFASKFETGAQFAETTAATVMVVMPLLLAFLFFQKQFINSFMQSGMK